MPSPSCLHWVHRICLSISQTYSILPDQPCPSLPATVPRITYVLLTSPTTHCTSLSHNSTSKTHSIHTIVTQRTMAATSPVTPESLSQRTASITNAIARISSAAAAYAETSKKILEDADGSGNNDIKNLTTEAAAQESLAIEVKNLLSEVQGPMGALLDLIGSLCRTTALRCLLDLGVFTTLPPDGTPMTADALLSQLPVPDVEKALLIRLLRNATAPGVGPLVETDEETYAQTGASSVLGAPGLAAMFRQLFDECFPALVMMPEFFREGGKGWRVPAEASDCPYTFAHRTGGLDMWQYIARFPERQANCNVAMKAQGFEGVWAVGLYPFLERASGLARGGEDVPLVVDVGGGAGYTSRRIRELCAGVKGTVVLQDFEKVLADAEDVDGVVKMAHDFFAEQPIKGAPIYYLRRILHDWSDDACVTILRHLAAAMDRALPSRVVIAEQILPTRGVSNQSAFVDMFMMTCTGMERTERQWGQLLARAGLRIEKVYTTPGIPFGAIEAVLV
ncbi:Demethylsterigmatocystin 6-O-methyltransferase [Cytospora mali]|uniref:Demethylsterigmatocystin 6-O-methyltransferase n=1 Tax=Cytospora mali TaxID=578113 RepID=A0A194VID0_CYTMA|nr:Demethylsterigmatocystin 6-O-methyltransferase [Valsa mali]